MAAGIHSMLRDIQSRNMYTEFCHQLPIVDGTTRPPKLFMTISQQCCIQIIKGAQQSRSI